MDQTIRDLRAARQRAGMSQAELAARMGTTQSAVARLESPGSDPRLHTVERYARALGSHLVVSDAAPTLTATSIEMRSALTENTPEDALRLAIQWLDDVATLDQDRRYQAMHNEPNSTGDRRWDALLAGLAEYVAGRYGLRVPGWASAPGRFLKTFWFVIEDIVGRPMNGLAALAFVNAPPALANRGVFLDRSALISI